MQNHDTLSRWYVDGAARIIWFHPKDMAREDPHHVLDLARRVVLRSVVVIWKIRSLDLEARWLEISGSNRSGGTVLKCSETLFVNFMNFMKSWLVLRGQHLGRCIVLTLAAYTANLATFLVVWLGQQPEHLCPRSFFIGFITDYSSSQEQGTCMYQRPSFLNTAWQRMTLHSVSRIQRKTCIWSKANRKRSEFLQCTWCNSSSTQHFPYQRSCDTCTSFTWLLCSIEAWWRSDEISGSVEVELIIHGALVDVQHSSERENIRILDISNSCAIRFDG